MSIGKKFRIIKRVSIIQLIAFSVMLALAIINQKSLNRTQEVRYESFLLANELRMSSDDLTRLARTYVVTGDNKYEAMYWNILDVRNGVKPRPDGRIVSLRNLMENLGFTKEEFEKLRIAENNSNDLVTTETIAMNAIKGLYDDGAGRYTRKSLPDSEMARKIMHDDQYHINKEKIMVPIREFEKMLDGRTNGAVESRVAMGNLLLGLMGLLAFGIISAFLFTMSNVNAVLKRIVGQLDESTSNSQKYSQTLVHTSSEFSSIATEQAAAIQQTVSTLNEINAMVKKSMESAEKSTDVAKKSQSTAEKGKDSVQQMISSNREIGESNEMIIKEVESNNKRLEEIVLIINEISSKTKVINDIVFQTKLLSFNASVEAARAGEQGKGFAVVAEEVGTLAQMSGTASKEISDLLARSVQKVDEIIKATTSNIQSIVNQSRSKVERGTHIAQTCDAELTEVVRIVSQVNVMMEEISRASEEQSRGVNEIATAMNQLDTATNQTSSMAAEVAQCAQDLATNNNNLKDLVSEVEKTLLNKEDSNSSNSNHLQ